MLNLDRRKFLKVTGAAVAAGAMPAHPDTLRALADATPTVPAKPSELCFMSARELAGLIRTRKLSARELMAACLDQINRVNPRINALVAKLDDDERLALAAEADRRTARRDALNPLHGLPTAFKDVEAAVGFPFTRGSLIYKGFKPAEDTVVVERMRNAGMVPIGKTNVPEFGMGSHTYNKVYGTTVNPYERRGLLARFTART